MPVRVSKGKILYFYYFMAIPHHSSPG